MVSGNWNDYSKIWSPKTIFVLPLFLFTVSSAAAALINLKISGDSTANVSSFQVSSDGQYVVYMDKSELFSVPINGGTPIRLNSDLVAGGEVIVFSISPDSSRVVYSADQQSYQVSELYSVPITGGIPIKLNSDLVTGDNVLSFSMADKIIDFCSSRWIGQ